MNINALRDLIRDYTQAFDHADINKRLKDSNITKDVLKQMLHHQDTAKSMATFGINKIFTPEKESQNTFQLNRFEKLILGLSVIQILLYSFLQDFSHVYISEYLGLIVFLILVKHLALYFDKKVETISEQSEKNKPKLEYIVLRENRRVKIEESDLVVGDLIYLKAGFRIPVDGLMISGNSLIVNEFAVSGEPQNYVKKVLDNCKGDTSCPVLLSHTHVING